MLYVFLVLALLASCALTWAASGFATLHALWQVPVFFAGSFLALVLLFLLVVLISCLFVDPKKLLEKPSGYFRFLLNEFCRLALALGGVHVNVAGLEKVPRDSRFLLVSNHATHVPYRQTRPSEPFPPAPLALGSEARFR